MITRAISKAYQAENLVGSYCTAPLRAYNVWFQNKIQTSENGYERTAWKISHVVSGIFAYLTLGLLALVGIAINLCLIPPENGYSLWARLTGVPEATEDFCKKIRSEISISCKIKTDGSVVLANSSSARFYTYDLNHCLSFDLQDVFEDTPLLLIQADGPVIEIENGEKAPCLQQNKTLSQAHLRRTETHIVYIQNIIRSLSQQYSWYPEKHCIKTVNNRLSYIIPLPDHIPFPNSN